MNSACFFPNFVAINIIAIVIMYIVKIAGNTGSILYIDFAFNNPNTIQISNIAIIVNPIFFVFLFCSFASIHALFNSSLLLFSNSL